MAHPYIDCLAQIISPFSLKLLKCQLQQAAYYLVEETEEEGVFRLTRPPLGGPALLDVSADGDDADVGLDSSSYSAPPRLTTFASCSCQFSDCYGVPCRHILRLHEVKQQPLTAALCSTRWHIVGVERVGVLVAELRRRQPPRSAPAPPPTSRDNFAAIMQECRTLAELAAADATLFGRARAGVQKLCDELRPSPRAAPAAGAARASAAAVLPGPDKAAEGVRAERCRSCWEMGHRKNNRDCPRFGMQPLEKPDDDGRAAAVTVRSRGGHAADEEEWEEEEEEEEEEADDSHENVCHSCGEVGELVCCSGCRHAFHGDCLSLSAQARLEELNWRCPICVGLPLGRTVGNPQRLVPLKACGKRRARKRGPADPTPAAGRAAKRAAYAAGNGKGAAKRY